MDFINLPNDVVMHHIFLYVPKYYLRLTNKENWRERSKIQYVPDWACLPKDHDWYKK